jgi:hypothetical protein
MTSRLMVRTRRVRETLLVVGEGEADIAFVRFIKRIYSDALGRSVQEYDAKGKGGKNVLDTALRRANNNRAYDKVVLLLDIDTDWDDACRARARKSRIAKRGMDVIESDPCLEAWLLKILGVDTEGDTRHMKREFKLHTGCQAHEPEWMARHLSRDVLDQARERVPQLAVLMNHMGIAKRQVSP